MERTVFLDALRRVQPALSASPRLPTFGAVFFDGQRATAYGEELAIVTPCAFSFLGGVEGKLLTAWVGGCSGSEVSAEESSGEARFRCSRSHVTLPVLDPELLPYEQPTGSGIEIREPERLVETIARAIPFAGNDDAHAWRQGVTVSLGDVAGVYATDNTTLFHGRALVEADGEAAVALPLRFVRALVALSKEVAVEAIEIGDGWATASFEDETQLFTRTSGEAAPERFDSILADLSNQLVKRAVPEALPAAVSNVAKLIAGLGDKAHTDCCLRVRGGVLEIVTSESGRAAARESLDLDHPDVLVWVPAKELLRASADATELAIGEDAVLFWSDDSVAAVSVAR